MTKTLMTWLWRGCVCVSLCLLLNSCSSSNPKQVEIVADQEINKYLRGELENVPKFALESTLTHSFAKMENGFHGERKNHVTRLSLEVSTGDNQPSTTAKEEQDNLVDNTLAVTVAHTTPEVVVPEDVSPASRSVLSSGGEDDIAALQRVEILANEEERTRVVLADAINEKLVSAIDMVKSDVGIANDLDMDTSQKPFSAKVVEALATGPPALGLLGSDGQQPEDEKLSLATGPPDDDIPKTEKIGIAEDLADENIFAFADVGGDSIATLQSYVPDVEYSSSVARVGGDSYATRVSYATADGSESEQVIVGGDSFATRNTYVDKRDKLVSHVYVQRGDSLATLYQREITNSLANAKDLTKAKEDGPDLLNVDHASGVAYSDEQLSAVELSHWGEEQLREQEINYILGIGDFELNTDAEHVDFTTLQEELLLDFEVVEDSNVEIENRSVQEEEAHVPVVEGGGFAEIVDTQLEEVKIENVTLENTLSASVNNFNNSEAALKNNNLLSVKDEIGDLSKCKIQNISKENGKKVLSVICDDVEKIANKFPKIDIPKPENRAEHKKTLDEKNFDVLQEIKRINRDALLGKKIIIGESDLSRVDKKLLFERGTP